MENQIRLIIADDHPLVRDGLKSFLQKTPEFKVIAEAENGTQLLRLLEEHQPDVVLVDISMPQLNGLEALQQIHQQYPGLKVIVLTMHEEPEYILKSISNGAHAYLLKNAEPEELQRAIKIVMKGAKYFSPTVSAIVMENLAKPEPEEEALTPRELEVLQLICRGLSNYHIAADLFISIRTVEKHRVNVLRKMQAVNTADLVRKAIGKGLIQ